MTGEPLPELPPMQASNLATEVMFQVAKVQSRYWKCIDVKACEPLEGGSRGDAGSAEADFPIRASQFDQ